MTGPARSAATGSASDSSASGPWAATTCASWPGTRDTLLAAVADPDADAVAAVTAQTGAVGFTDPMAMIAESELDGIIIAAPTTFHGPLAHAAIARGVPVLVEKPLAATHAEALAIVAAGRAAGVPVQVGHVERYNPAVLRLGELLHQGWLTSIFAIVSRRAGPFPARIRDVGVTVDLATHDADMLSWVAGERPARVYAELAQRKHASHEDLLFGLLHFPSGRDGDARRQLAHARQAPPARRHRRGGHVRARLPHPAPDVHEADRHAHPRSSPATRRRSRATSSRSRSRPRAARRQLDAFVRIIRTGERPIVDGEDGAWAVHIATALLDSGGVDGPPVDPGTVGEARRRMSIVRRPSAGSRPCSVAPSRAPERLRATPGRDRSTPGRASPGRRAPWPSSVPGKMGLPLAAQFAATAGT